MLLEDFEVSEVRYIQSVWGVIFLARAYITSDPKLLSTTL